MQIVVDDDTTVFNDTQNDVEPQSDSTNDPIEGAVNKETVMEAANIDTTEEAANNETIEQTNDMIEEESVRKDTKIQLFKCSCSIINSWLLLKVLSAKIVVCFLVVDLKS